MQCCFPAKQSWQFRVCVAFLLAWSPDAYVYRLAAFHGHRTAQYGCVGFLPGVECGCGAVLFPAVTQSHVGAGGYQCLRESKVHHLSVVYGHLVSFHAEHVVGAVFRLDVRGRGGGVEPSNHPDEARAVGEREVCNLYCKAPFVLRLYVPYGYLSVKSIVAAGAHPLVCAASGHAYQHATGPLGRRKGPRCLPVGLHRDAERCTGYGYCHSFHVVVKVVHYGCRDAKVMVLWRLQHAIFEFCHENNVNLTGHDALLRILFLALHRCKTIND